METFFRKIFLLFKMLFVFTGRLNRLSHFILLIVASIFFAFIYLAISLLPESSFRWSILTLSLCISILVVNFSLLKRRLHDLGHSVVWAICFTLFPLLPILINMESFLYIHEKIIFALFVYVYFIKGTVGPNKYGEDPLKVNPLQFLRDVHKK